VLIAPIRHPLHIAEEAALLDGISDGRVELGLGAGYLPIDFTPFGVDRAKRFRMLDEIIPEVRRLLDHEVMPRPVQDRLPIWAGYVGPVGARRAGLMGEYLQSAHPAFLQPYLDGL
jgi:alkanesulfonate monooxygenase SsuD/methylene tetrahydromethanopterin reductase-like flavin-dependent oxidoreductase (luciferase family)